MPRSLSVTACVSLALSQRPLRQTRIGSPTHLNCVRMGGASLHGQWAARGGIKLISPLCTLCPVHISCWFVRGCSHKWENCTRGLSLFAGAATSAYWALARNVRHATGLGLGTPMGERLAMPMSPTGCCGGERTGEHTPPGFVFPAAHRRHCHSDWELKRSQHIFVCICLLLCPRALAASFVGKVRKM